MGNGAAFNLLLLGAERQAIYKAFCERCRFIRSDNRQRGGHRGIDWPAFSSPKSTILPSNQTTMRPVKTNRLTSRAFLTRNTARLLALAGMSFSAPSVFAATGIWTNLGDTFWNDTANTEWTGVTGNAWDATNGPNNIAQFNSGLNANIGTSGTPVANGIIWNGVSGGISSGGVKLDGTNPFVSVSSGQNANFFGNLTGTNGFTKTGAGTVNLDGGGGVKGITGGITVNQGAMRITLGASPNTVNSSNAINLSGSQLEAFGNNSQTLSTFTLGNGGSRIVLNPNGGGNSVTLSLANWTRASNSSALIDTIASGVAKTLTLTGTIPSLSNGIIGGYATVRDSGTTYGFATLDGSNNVVRYTGATVVNAALGADTVSTTNYKATTAGTWFNGAGTPTQTLNSLESAIAGTVSGNNATTYILNSGGLLFSDTSNTTNGGNANMTFTSATSELHIATMQYNSGFAVPTVRGVTDNGGLSVSLIKDGTGGLSMVSGTFTYTGDTIVNDGILYGVANMPTGTGKGNLVANSRGTVTVGITTSGTRIINGLSNTTLGGGTVNNQNFTSTAATSFLDLGNGNATASFSSAITGAFGIIKSGTGTQTFSGNNNYTGTTQVNAGTLQFTKTASLYNNTSANWTAANINVKNGATLAINVGGTGEFTTGNVTTLLTNLAASSSSTNGMNAGSSLGFDTTNASSGTFTISDVIADTTGASGGTRGLTKLGTGKLTLSNGNSYTGSTAVKAGTLEVSGNLSATTALSVTGGTLLLSGAAGEQVNNGATVALGGGTLAFNNAGNQIETLGALTLSPTWRIRASLRRKSLIFKEGV